jgi:hypothetical protein
MKTEKNERVVPVMKTIMTGNIEGSREIMRPNVVQLDNTFNWGKIIKKLLKTKRK